MTYEGLRLKVQKYQRILPARQRRKRLKDTRFTILSNNCWGGMIYESYDLPKQTPTVGCFIMPDDYIRFLTRLDDYLRAPLTFISPEESRWKKEVCGDKRYGHYPIGNIEITGAGGRENIELFFMHFQSSEEAKEKWERRLERIDREHLLVKFNDQNGCTQKHIEAFEALPFRHKVCFTATPYPDSYKSVRTIRVPKGHEYIRTSYEPFGRNRQADVTEMINELFS